MKTFSGDYLHKVASDIFKACSSPSDEAEIVANHLVDANLMGFDSHGVIRVPQYVQDIRQGAIIPGAPIRITKETATTAIVDVGWNFGQVGALRATEIAINKARENALGCVVVRHCRHVGCVGTYPRKAAEQDFVGIAICGSAGEGHRVCPWGGREGRLATNPIAFAVPTEGNPIAMDFATSMASEGKVRLMLNRGDKLPKGWIIDSKGHPSTEPNDLYGPPPGAILPFGGSQGYKGLALSLMAQILSSLLGAPSWREEGVASNANNMWLLVIDIRAFMSSDEFHREVEGLIKYIKSSKLQDGFKEILVPGELDFRKKEIRKRDGIPVEAETWRQIEKTASELGVRI